VHNNTAGIPDSRPMPNAANDAERSSWNTWSEIFGLLANAIAIGVLRDPGDTTA